MDSSEATKVVIDRITKLEPEHIAKKIIGFMYFQDFSGQEMIRLALGPDSLIHSLIQRAKTSRLIASSPVISPPISPNMNPTPFRNSFVSPPPPFSPRRMDPYWDHQQPVDYYCPEAAFNNLSNRGGRNPSNLIDYPVKPCHYFSKGFCKHGSNCRYYHGESHLENYSHTFGPSSFEVAEDDQGFSQGSLDILELEIVELLKSRRGVPVSIASLPMMYYEKYGRTLQAEGYLTESQRHGKAGYSLTKLLARLKNSIRLIDRPHGQHAVILSEDAAKYADTRGERNDPGPIVSGSRQIYMTFPAESTFSDEDVSNYFCNFGAVQDVRIPCQQRRMFGFVTFASADTVKLILSKGNPHFICGARVLVKPYREKPKLVERKYSENLDHPVYYHSHNTHIDSELQSNWELMRRQQLMEQAEYAVELEMRLQQLQLSCKPMATQSCFGYSMDGLNIPEDYPKFTSTDNFNYLFGSTSDDNSSGQVVSLPDSPFASAVASSLSAVI
ncbi:hypothetical protein ACS0TY_033390 [Phlomoides rotata]